MEIYAQLKILMRCVAICQEGQDCSCNNEEAFKRCKVNSISLVANWLFQVRSLYVSNTMESKRDSMGHLGTHLVSVGLKPAKMDSFWVAIYCSG